MNMLKIYGSDLSGPSNKVRMTANALGAEYEYISVSIRDGETRTEKFLKMHPAGKVPVIDDNGFVLFESGAIIKYLASKQESPLYPSDKKQRAVIDQWTDFSILHVGTAMSKVVYNRIFAPLTKVPVDETSLAEGIKFLKRFLPIVDQQLSKGAYIAGSQLSLADISLLSVLDPAEVAGIDLAPYPNISKWRAGLMKKDFYAKCHASYKDAVNKTMSKK
jgi:glutathione S-transferase